MIGILVEIAVFQFKLFANNGTKFGAPGNRTPLKIMNKPVSSLDDCYYKVYKAYKGEGYDDAGAATTARRYCLKGVAF